MNRTQVVLMLILAMTVSSLAAQEAGDVIVFALPQFIDLSILGSDDPGDKIIFVGRATETTDGGTCAFGTAFYIQSVVIVDPRASGRVTRHAQAITTSPVPPGTRVKDISSFPQCEIGGVTYVRYTGFVE